MKASTYKFTKKKRRRILYSIYCLYSSYMSVINLNAEFTLISNVNSFPQMIFLFVAFAPRSFLHNFFSPLVFFFLVFLFVFVIFFSSLFFLVCLSPLSFSVFFLFTPFISCRVFVQPNDYIQSFIHSVRTLLNVFFFYFHFSCH